MFGLSFLNSFFFWGLAAASLPIIIHLIKRNRAIKLPFAAMRFLQAEPNKQHRSQRLKQIILLMMRITALALLALAFARPFLENGDTGTLWGDQPKAVVVMIDNSFSMAKDDHLAQAVEQAKKIVRSFSPRDHVQVMQFAETTETVGAAESNFSALANLLDDRISLSNAGTNYLQALQAAESALLEAPATYKYVYMISDFQRTAWERLNPHWRIQSGINLNLIPVGDGNAANIAVLDVHVTKPDKDRRRADVLARVKNFGTETQRVSLVLRMNNRKTAQRNFTLQPGTEQVVRFRRVAAPAGYVTGQVTLVGEKGGLMVDNSYFFILETQSRAQILAVDGEPDRDLTRDELFFLDRALNLPGYARFSLIKTTSKKLPQFDFSEYRAVILANVQDLPRAMVKRLTYYVRSGGGLIIALGDRTNPNIFNSLFQELTPATLNNRAFRSVERENGVILAEVDYQHPIFRLFSDAGQGDLSTAQFYQYFHVEPLSPESVLAAFDDGSPAILERKVGSGKVILLTSSLDSEWNDLPVKAMYLPLLYQTLEYVASQRKGQNSFLVGNSVPLQRFGVGDKEVRQASIKTPAGQGIDLDGSLFEQTGEPGIYEVWRKGQKQPVAYFAVNVDPKESDLAGLPPEELQAKVAEVTNDEILTASLTVDNPGVHLEKHQRLWRFGILLAIFLLVGETWLANRTYR